MTVTKTLENKNIYWHQGEISKADRQRQAGHRGICLWFTGLPGSGKSSIAREVEKILFEREIWAYVLDGDNIRHGLNRDLGFTPRDRCENIRRIGEVAKLFADAGIMVITAFISPYREDRERARHLFADGDFIEVYVEADLQTCQARDSKGLYEKAHRGEIPDFTGVSAPYEGPQNPELTINTTQEADIHTNALKVVSYLEENGYFTIK